MQAYLPSKKIHLTIDAELLAQVDALAQRDYMKRSQILRMALIEFIRKESNATEASSKPGEDVELQKFLFDYHKAHPESGLI